jgi:L-serine deaminase
MHGEQDRKFLYLMEVLEKTALHHAVERGLTAGYLGAMLIALKRLAFLLL